MLAFIKGTVEEIGEDYLVLENQGMGFFVRVPGSVLSNVSGVHQQVTLHTYMYVREDEISLYGFLTRDALKTFQSLITVNGVGPKVANAILTALTVDELKMAVLSGDVKALTKANGIGTKGAQRIIMELKDKISLDDYMTPPVGGHEAEEDVMGEAALALVSLGYSQTEAYSAIRKVDGADAMSVEALIKAALKKLF